MSESEVSQALSALRRRVRAMFTLIRERYGIENPLARRIQVLWHMLTGISPKFAGLAALPDVRHWVLMNMIDAGINSLSELRQLTQCPSTINVGLLGTLQQQTAKLLERYGSEDALLLSFTERFPAVGQQSGCQLVA